MQRAEDSSSRVAPDPERSGLKPAVAFLGLILVVAVVGTIVFLTRPAPAPEPRGTTTATTEPNFALTDEEAIARFEELNAQLVAAYEARDVSILEAFLTNDSPLRTRAANEIRQLLRDRVVPRPKFDTRSIEVISNDPTEIVLRQTAVDSSRFESEVGEEITKHPKDILRVVEWTLELEGSIWRIAESSPIQSRQL